MPWFCPSSRVRRARSTSVPHESLYLSKKFVKELSRETLQFHGTSSHSDVEIGKLKNLGLVVVKTFRPRRDSRADTNGLQHALMEWKRVASHPNIIDFEGLWVRPYRVFPSLVLRKMDLDAVQYVSANPTADKSSVVYQVGLALEFIHSQTPPVIHGSVKSSNVLMDDCGRAYLSDIGIRDAICCSGQLDSQMRWDAPERIFHDPEEPLHRCSSSDVWSFGMTALEIYTCRHPFSNYPHEALVVHAMERREVPRRPIIIHDDLWRTLEMCWHYVPSNRPTMSVLMSKYLGRVSTDDSDAGP